MPFLGLATSSDLEKLKKELMATQAQLAADLRAVLAQQQKTLTEIQGVQSAVDTLKARVAELEAIIASQGGEASQELVDAVAAVKAQAQTVDDAIPDAPTPPPPAPENPA